MWRLWLPTLRLAILAMVGSTLLTRVNGGAPCRGMLPPYQYELPRAVHYDCDPMGHADGSVSRAL